MATKTFINLPVKDLSKSVDFFTSLGFRFDPQFTDEKATCMIISEECYVMLLVEEFFKTFINKPLADARNTAQVIISLSADNKEDVNAMIQNALRAGGSSSSGLQDHGWMYQHGFEDLDGHLWEIAYMDLSAFPQE